MAAQYREPNEVKLRAAFLNFERRAPSLRAPRVKVKRRQF